MIEKVDTGGAPPAAPDKSPEQGIIEDLVVDGAAPVAPAPPGPGRAEPSPAGHRSVMDLVRARPVLTDTVGLVLVVLALAFLWGRGRGIWYWLDEGLSVGIASHPLSELPGLLRQDGSPPLYYGILHLWMRVFGTSEPATHALSLVFALGTVIAAWWAGKTLFGRRTAWVMVVLTAVSPFLASYANETRMYTLVVLLAMVATASFFHAFVFGRRRYLAPFAVALTLLLYTHNWALFFTLGLGIALLPCVLIATDRRRLVIDAFLAFGAVGLLYAPWIPTLLFQVEHTGAPWAPRPTFVRVREELELLLGGQSAVVAIGLGTGTALIGLLSRALDRASAVLLGSATIVAVVLVTGWAVSRSSSVWTYRYLGVIVPAILVVAALGLACGGRVALAALTVVVFLSAPIGVKTPPYVKSNVRGVTEAMSPSMRPGDLVISPDYGEIPVLAHYLPAGLRYATTEGPEADEYASDQREGLDRLRNSRLQEAIPPLIDDLPGGSRVLLVCPPPSAPTPEDVEFILLILQRCQEVEDLLVADPRLQVEKRVVAAPLQVENTPLDAVLLVKA